MKTQTIKLSELVATHYAGLSQERIIACIVGPSGLSQHAVRNALRGFRVAPETAEYLREWARTTHRVALDVTELLLARPKGRKPPRPSVVDRVRMRAVLRDVGLPANLEYVAVVLLDARDGEPLWRLNAYAPSTADLVAKGLGDTFEGACKVLRNDLEGAPQ